MSKIMDNLQALVKALEAGGYNAAPSKLVQGCGTYIEDIAPVMQTATFDAKRDEMIEAIHAKFTTPQTDPFWIQAQEIAAMQAAKNLAADIEFDLFRGKADFSDAFNKHTHNVSYYGAPTKPILARACECGAEKCRSNFHSDWCPKHG